MIHRRTAQAFAALALAAGVSIASAQVFPGQDGATPAQNTGPSAPVGEEVRMAPEVRDPGNPPLIWNYALVFLLVAAAVGVNCIPSKRGHQD